MFIYEENSNLFAIQLSRIRETVDEFLFIKMFCEEREKITLTKTFRIELGFEN